MNKHLTILLLTVLFTTSCSKQEKLDEKIIGIWTMEKVFEYGNDVTIKHNPRNDRWIEFKADGSFVSDGEPFGRNTGRWSADNDNFILFIDSDIDDDDSEWEVTFHQDQTTWTGIGHPRKERTKLIHKRKNN